MKSQPNNFKSYRYNSESIHLDDSSDSDRDSGSDMYDDDEFKNKGKISKQEEKNRKNFI